MRTRLLGVFLILFSFCVFAAEPAAPGSDPDERSEDVASIPAKERKFSQLDWDGSKNFYELLGLAPDATLPELQIRLAALKATRKKSEKADFELLKEILDSPFSPTYDWVLPFFQNAAEEDIPTVRQQLEFCRYYFYTYLPSLRLPKFPKITAEGHRAHFLDALVKSRGAYSFPVVELLHAHNQKSESTAAEVHREVEGLKRDIFPRRKALWWGGCGTAFVLLAGAYIRYWPLEIGAPPGNPITPPTLKDAKQKGAETKPPEKGILFQKGVGFGKDFGGIDGP